MRLTRLHDDDRGATLVLTVISLLVLLSFVALAVDGGAAFLDVRKSQNAADNAAMAGSLEVCAPTGSSDAETAALAVAADNGYSAGVTVTPSGEEVQVDISTTSSYYFLSAIPFIPDSFTVNVSATADCVTIPGPGDYALFGQGSCGTDSVSISASDIQVGNDNPTDNITGAVYSGEFSRFTGADVEVEGPVQTVGAGNKNEVPGDTVLIEGVEPQPYPEPLGSLEFADLNLGWDPNGEGWNRNDPPGTPVTVDVDGTDFVFINYGDADIDRGILSDPTKGEHLIGNELQTKAVYVTTGDIDLSLTGTDPLTFASGVSATFVAGNSINIKKAEMLLPGNADAYFKPGPEWGPGLLLFAAGGGGPVGCGDSNFKGIKTSTNGLTWTGILFAPFGEVKISSPSGVTNKGPIYAWNIDLSGSGYDIVSANDDNFKPEKRVVLVDTSP